MSENLAGLVIKKEGNAIIANPDILDVVGGSSLGVAGVNKTRVSLNIATQALGGGGTGAGGIGTYFGGGAPGGLHNNGDRYFDTNTSPYTIYVQRSDVWVAVTSQPNPWVSYSVSLPTDFPLVARLMNICTAGTDWTYERGTASDINITYIPTLTPSIYTIEDNFPDWTMAGAIPITDNTTIYAVVVDGYYDDGGGAVFYGSAVFSSSDFGSTFTLFNIGIVNNPYASVTGASIANGKIFAVTDYLLVLSSGTWTQATVENSVVPGKIIYFNSKYYGISGSDIYWSANGTTWTYLSTPNALDTVNYISQAGASTLLVAMNANGIMKSTDNGSTWTDDTADITASSSMASLYNSSGTTVYTKTGSSYFVKTY